MQRTLPNVQVAISCFDRTHTVDAESPAINPRFARNKQRFENVALSNVVSIKVCISLWCVCCVCVLWLMVSVQNGWSAIQVWIRVMQGREMRACVGTMLPFREELVLQAF